MKYPKVKDLSCAAIDAKPVDFDWSEGYGETWDIVIPQTNDWDKKQCMAWLDGENLELEDISCDEDSDISVIQERIRERMSEDSDRFVPVMNYYYPLPGLSMKPEEAQAILDEHCSLAVVLLNGDTVMALTGGGMDFSWDICEAYMRLGYLPPVHFRLPKMGGESLKSAKTRWVLAGYTRSCVVARRWAENRSADIRSLRAWLKSQDDRK